MNKETIKAAIKDGTLRKYDLTSVKIGDKVLGWEPGEVIAVYGSNVVIGWDSDDGKTVVTYLANYDHGIYLAPLCWVEDKPVYKGDTLYWQNGKQVTVLRLNGDGTFLLFEEGGSWSTDGRISKLSWTDPTILFDVEGKPVRKGDVLYSPKGVVVKRVVSHVVPYESYDKEDNPVTALRVWGDDGLWDKPEKLTWTDPTVLFEVEGKPVRKGDVLYGTWLGNQAEGYEITGKDVDGRPMWRDGVVLTESLDDLTWTKPKAPPLNINGHIVPAPEREPLPNGTMYYVPYLFGGTDESYWWGDDGTDHHFLNSGLIHLTEEAATAHSQALLSLTKS